MGFINAITIEEQPVNTEVVDPEYEPDEEPTKPQGFAAISLDHLPDEQRKVARDMAAPFAQL